MPKQAPRRANGTGTVYKLKGARAKPWIAQVPGVPKKVVNKHGITVKRRTWITLGYYKTKSDAEKALAMQLINPVAENHRITLSELFEEWSSAHFEHVGTQAQSLYNGAFALLEVLHAKVFKEIRTAQYQAVINQTDKSYSYKRAVKAMLNLLYKYAMENDICNKNYAQFIRLRNTIKKDIVVFTDTEIKTLFKNDTVPGVDMILMLIYSGFRAQEFLNLTTLDVDLENGTVTGGMKTESGTNRIVPIHAKTRQYWENHLTNASDFLFVYQGHRLTYGTFTSKLYYPALEILKIPRKTPHKCRDTFATLLAKDGADTLAIQQMMGHSNYAFTANTYTAKDIEYLKQNLLKIK